MMEAEKIMKEIMELHDITKLEKFNLLGKKLSIAYGVIGNLMREIIYPRDCSTCKFKDEDEHCAVGLDKHGSLYVTDSKLTCGLYKEKKILEEYK